MSGRGALTAAAADPRFAAAHRALIGDDSVQFRPSVLSPPKLSKPPAWLHSLGEWLRWALRPVGRALHWLGGWLPDWPFARLLLWTVLAVLAATLIWVAVDRLRYGEWRWPRWRRRVGTEPLPDDAPWIEPARSRAWLQEADALAALGRFAEAAHLLLFRSVEDLARRRPQAVKPALTARELAAASAFPPLVRERFAGIARLVERSLFGGRPVGADDWRTARASYAELATPGAWRQ